VKTPPPLVFPEAREAWQIFDAVRSQVIASSGFGVVMMGISHEAVFRQLELRRIPEEDRLEIFDMVRMLERMFVTWFNGRQRGKRG